MKNATKRLFVIFMLIVLCFSLTACTDSGVMKNISAGGAAENISAGDVVEEIYTGSEYMSGSDTAEYVSGLLGQFLGLYTIDENDSYFLCTLEDSDYAVENLEQTVFFSDGTCISVPCIYSDVKSTGWISDESESAPYESGSLDCGQFRCTNSKGWRITLQRSYEADGYHPINDSTIETISISTGSFSMKDNYACILSSNPEFEYMGINRSSSPSQVIDALGIPNHIEHDHVNMTFEYYIYDSVTGERTNVSFCWLTMKDCPAIMRDFDIRVFYL